jgi:prepilin-type processing-associated H-X9-DG protein
METEGEATSHSRAGRSRHAGGRNVAMADMAAPQCQRSASIAVTPPHTAAVEATLVVARQLLNNPPPPHTSPSVAVQWRHDIDQLIVTTINTLPHRLQLLLMSH